MAGAFVAVADDATAAYWNPAGLSMGAFLSLLVDRTTRDSTVAGLGRTEASSTFAGLSTNAVALSYYRLRVAHIGAPQLPSVDSGISGSLLRSMTLDNVVLTGAQLLTPNLSFGTSIRYVRGAYGVGSSAGRVTGGGRNEAQALDQRGENAIDWDVGMKMGRGPIHFGLVARNLLQPTLHAPDGSVFRLDRHVRVGAAIRLAGRSRIAMDVDLVRQTFLDGRRRRNVSLGAEHWFGDWLAVRAGIRTDLDTASAERMSDSSDVLARIRLDDRAPVAAFGFSVPLTTGVYLDGHFTRGRADVERGWGVAGRVGF